MATRQRFHQFYFRESTDPIIGFRMMEEKYSGAMLCLTTSLDLYN